MWGGMAAQNKWHFACVANVSAQHLMPATHVGIYLHPISIAGHDMCMEVIERACGRIC